MCNSEAIKRKIREDVAAVFIDADEEELNDLSDWYIDNLKNVKEKTYETISNITKEKTGAAIEILGLYTR